LSNGKLQAYKGDLTTTLGSPSANSLVSGVLQYIEVKALFDTTNGTLEVRVNGTSSGWLNLTGIDTQATANATANQVIFGGDYSIDGSKRYICDVVVWDTSGSFNNDFMGEVNVDAFFPTGAGTYSQFTPSAGSNYTCVDESDPNTSDYVSTHDDGNKDSYTFADVVGNSPSVKAVVNNLWMKKSNSGVAYMKGLCRSGGTDYTGTAATPLTTYSCSQTAYEADPATSGVWTQSAFNNSEFGVQMAITP
jgi:hypothetical protein